MVDDKIWLLLGLVWVLWFLIDKRKNRPSQPHKIKKFKLFRDKPADLKDSIYHPKEWRKPKR
ncbi:hypothetical protein [Thiobacillus sp.]|uniref:hypothetical protein n=1 Tax=Thiobacillus sp. TaxID=924 RepID=UPI00286D6F80|nr:hypothetical protein [Thiobacillus sp.]